MKTTRHVLPMFCACSFHGNSMNNVLSYCGLVDARISASEKDLPVKPLNKAKSGWSHKLVKNFIRIVSEKLPKWGVVGCQKSHKK